MFQGGSVPCRVWVPISYLLLDSQYILQTIVHYQQTNTCIVCTLPKRAKHIRVKVDGHRAALPTDAEHVFHRSAKIGTWCVFASHFILCARPDLAGSRPTLFRSQDLRLLSEVHFSRNIPHAASFHLFQTL